MTILDIRDDVQVELQFSNPQTNNRLRVQLFSEMDGVKTSLWEAKPTDIEMVTPTKVIVRFNYKTVVQKGRENKGFFKEGKLHCAAIIGYKDPNFEDKYYDKYIPVDLDVMIINKDTQDGNLF